MGRMGREQRTFLRHEYMLRRPWFVKSIRAERDAKHVRSTYYAISSENAPSPSPRRVPSPMCSSLDTRVRQVGITGTVEV